jgi:hypothetical protein
MTAPTEDQSRTRLEEALEALVAVADSPPVDQVGPLADVDAALRETLDSIGDV